MSEYGPATHRLIHVSDPHLLGGPELLYGSADSEGNLVRALEDIVLGETRPDAVVFTGDLADTGDLQAYIKLRNLVEPACETLGAKVIWAMGNHDNRENFRVGLLGEEPSDSPIDVVHTVKGLRIITLDTSVPGHHYGFLTKDQLAWLKDELETPAPAGTILAMHHPPIPCVLEVAISVELRMQRRLADVIRGTDVRAILGGHLHYSTSATFAGIPVSVASATCYTQDLAWMSPHNFGQAYNLVHLYDDTVVHSVVPLIIKEQA